MQGDKSDAIQYYFDVRRVFKENEIVLLPSCVLKAFRHNPCDIKTLEWLASYYIETQYPEKAVEFCAQAALVKYEITKAFFLHSIWTFFSSSSPRPGEIKWHLMVASCYRRSGDYTAALEKYKWIHHHFPDDTDCKIESMKTFFEDGGVFFKSFLDRTYQLIMS